MSYMVKGYSFKMQEDFTSIPGLRGYYDGRYGVNLEGGKISSVLDLSSEGTLAVNTIANRRPLWTDGKWIDYVSVSGEFCSLYSNTKRDLNFLHNGQPFGVYGLSYFTFHSGANVSHVPLTTYSTFGTDVGMRLSFASQTSSGSMRVQVTPGGGTVRIITLTNLLNTGSTNYRVFPNAYTYSHVFLGTTVTNNQILRFDNIELITTDASILSEYPQGNHSTFSVGRNTQPSEIYRSGILLLYDFTGFSQAQIALYDSKIRTLLEAVKPMFV
jgi:hypothetical protein